MPNTTAEGKADLETPFVVVCPTCCCQPKLCWSAAPTTWQFNLQSYWLPEQPFGVMARWPARAQTPPPDHKYLLRNLRTICVEFGFLSGPSTWTVANQLAMINVGKLIVWQWSCCLVGKSSWNVMGHIGLYFTTCWNFVQLLARYF